MKDQCNGMDHSLLLRTEKQLPLEAPAAALHEDYQGIPVVVETAVAEELVEER
jgi:hypothetical protein